MCDDQMLADPISQGLLGERVPFVLLVSSSITKSLIHITHSNYGICHITSIVYSSLPTY